MHNHSPRSHLNSPSQPQQQVARSLQFVVFEVGSLKLAVPTQLTYKVTNYKAVHSSGLNLVGVTHIDNLEVTVIDLYQRLFKSNQASEFPPNNYLIIVQNSVDELCGIPTAKAPTLMEIPLSMIRVLPESYRHADTLEIASHVTVIPQETSTLTLFVLDVEQLLPNPFKGIADLSSGTTKALF